MSNNSSTTEAPFFDMGLGVPLWIVIVWVAVGVLVIAMIVLVFYTCHTRKSAAPSHDRNSEDEERRMSSTTFDNYPQAYIDELHTKRPISQQLFHPAFVHNMRIPRAVEVRMTDNPRGSRDYLPQQNVTEPPTITFEEIGIHSYEHSHYDDDDDFNELHPNKRITLSRDASFKASNISEENKAKQLYRERMLVNELREKIRRDNKMDEEDGRW